MLDLSRFRGFGTACLTPDQLHRVRRLFADDVISYAATCRDNRRLLEGLIAACDPALGLQFPRLLASGSTRDVYSLPFDLVLKLRRTSPLDRKEMERRGSRSYLEERRRTANVRELMFAGRWPTATPRPYGYSAEPDFVIVERVTRTLLDTLPGADDDADGLDAEDVWFTDQGIALTDRRFHRPSNGSIAGVSLTQLNGSEGLRLSNVGIAEDGRFLLLDSANFAGRLAKWSSPDAGKISTLIREGQSIPKELREEVWAAYEFHKTAIWR